MTSHEIFEEMQLIWQEFANNHTTYTAKGNKSAAARARKSIMSLKKLVSEYKKESLTETKKTT
jgi:hypothetical protein